MTDPNSDIDDVLRVDELREQIAEAAGFHNDTAVVSSRRCSTECKNMGEYRDVDGTDYEVEPPCNVAAVMRVIRDADDAMVMECSVDDSGHLHVFVPDTDPMDRLFS